MPRHIHRGPLSDCAFKNSVADLRNKEAVYYIDNVLLAPLTEAGPNHTFCAYAPPTPLGTCPMPPQTDPTYLWEIVGSSAPGPLPILPPNQSNIANPTVQPDYTTTYKLTTTVHGVQYAPSFTTITITAPALPSTPLLVNCGLSASLSVCLSDAPGAVYSWTTNNTVNYNVNTQGNTLTAYPTTAVSFYLNVSMPGRTRTYVTSRAVYVVPQAGPNQNIACGVPATLNTCGTAAGLPGASYYWETTGTAFAGLNPSVVPTSANTIYSLVISFQGQLLNGGPTTITINNGQPCISSCQSYYSNSNATYVNPVSGRPNTELGNADTNAPVTPIDGQGGTVVFDGIYHVVGPVKFEQGTFYLAPGTIFYVNGGRDNWTGIGIGSQCYSDLFEGDRYIQVFVGDGATLTLDGATITADCDKMWGGVELVNDGHLITQADPNRGRRSRISEAIVGVLLGTACRSTEAIYDLTYTDFYNNTYGVAVRGNSNLMQTSCRIQHCHFFSDHTQRLEPDKKSLNGGGDYTRTGLVLTGDWHQDIVYSKNDFDELYVGAELAGEAIDFDQNTLAACYGVGIRVGTPDVKERIGTIKVHDNYVTVPDNPLPGGQVPPGTDVLGLELLNMGLDQVPNGTLFINHNIVTGNSRRNPQKPLIGLDGYLCFEWTGIRNNNEFSTLDIGVRLMDASAQLSLSRTVADNWFNECDYGVALRGDTNEPIVSCNTFERTDYGIHLEAGADVGQLGYYGDYCGNQFNTLQAAVNNESPYGPVYYFGPSENTSLVGNYVLFLSAPGNRCLDRDYQYTNGLQRSTPGAGVSLATVQGWQQIVLTQNGTASELRQYERRILAYYAGLNQWAALEAFVVTLPLSNDAAYERLGLYLLETYRRLNMPADVQRMRTDLLYWRGTYPALRQRIAYFDVTEQLRQLLPGQRPTPADSTALAAVATSTTDYALVACATLRYFYPGVACSAASPPPPPAARPTLAVSAGAARSEKLRLNVVPNPAQEQVQLSLNAPCPGPARLELVALGSGQLVYTQAVPAAQRSLELNVAALSPGVYAARIIGPDGQPLATAKLVIVR